MTRSSLFYLLGILMSAAPAIAVVGGGDIIEDGRLRFSHNRHVVVAKNKCLDCHPKLYTSLQQHTHIAMDSMGEGKSCGFCHNGTKAFSVKRECARCHRIKV